MTIADFGALDARPAHPASFPGQRALGVLGVLASPLLLVEGYRYDFGQSRMDVWTSLGGVVYMLGALASVVALRRMRAAGDGRFATGVHWFQLAATLAAAAWSAAFLFTGPDGGGSNLLWKVGDAAWPLLHLSMLALGICTIAARRLPSWARYAPLAAGLALPAFFALAASGVPRPVAAATFGVLTTLGFCALGGAALASPAGRR